MSSPKLRLIEFGALTGVIYDFAKTDDILPLHSHGHDDVHITIIGSGAFSIYGGKDEDKWQIYASEGMILDWKEGQEHEFRAMRDNSKLINIHKYPKGINTS